LRTPDGEKMAAFGEYREIRPGEKLVYAWKWDDDRTPSDSRAVAQQTIMRQSCPRSD
jgi:uncharacterized protein YndB with AHSA1/START domain